MEAGATFEGGSSWNAIRISSPSPPPASVRRRFALNPPTPSGHRHRDTISRRFRSSLFLSTEYSRAAESRERSRIVMSVTCRYLTRGRVSWRSSGRAALRLIAGPLGRIEAAGRTERICREAKSRVAFLTNLLPAHQSPGFMSFN